jgi:4,5-DOPA dioxygenase extradiol
MNSDEIIAQVNELFPETETMMPAVFIGHGSPMNAIEDNQFVEGFKNIARTFQKPKAIISISAHWFINRTRVTAMENPKTIYDFYGFPDELYAVQYPVKGAPQLASIVSELLKPYIVDPDKKWGLDHGTWSVLRHFYPEADVPVIQLSIDNTASAHYHFELGKKLSSLRKRGILIMGSGNIVHNLRLVDFNGFDKDDYGYSWAREAKDIINNLISEENYARLIDYKKLGEAVSIAIPTPDHYFPLLYALGARQKDEPLTFYNDKLTAGSLSMTCVKTG